MTDYTTNVLRVYAQATADEIRDGLSWYSRANELARALDDNYVRSAGAIAALSPLLSWESNAKYAGLVYAGVPAKDIPCMTKNAQKAIDIMNGDGTVIDILSGPKVTMFWRNISNPESDNPEHVTIDKHAIDIATGNTILWSEYKGLRGFTKSARKEMADAYVNAAFFAGILPLQMQAITWIAHKRLKWES